MNDDRVKKIWIDLENSPHALFFHPIINELEKRGYEIVVTARDYAQTCKLAEKYGLKIIRIGKHYGKWKIAKILGGFIRAYELGMIMHKEKPDLAISHGSRTQWVVSCILKHKLVIAIDYEYVLLPPIFKPDLLLVPAVVCSTEKIKRFNNVFGYPGIKEDVYLNDYTPGPFPSQIGVNNEEHIIATLRPPATLAHYHTAKSDKIFDCVIDYLGTNSRVSMVVLPRTIEQGEEIEKKWPKLFNDRRIVFPSQVVDGPDLIWHSDLVISAGGTMTREAAALGVPAFSVFGGEIGAVDRYLVEQNRLVLIDKPEDISKKIHLMKRNPGQNTKVNGKQALKVISDHVENLISSS